MSTNPIYGTMTEEQIAEAQAVARAYSRAEAIVVLARAVLLASLAADGLAGACCGSPVEDVVLADAQNEESVRGAFVTAREFYRLAAETLEEAAKT